MEPFSLPGPHHHIPARLFRPPLSASTQRSTTVTAAVLAHPYAPLGGSYDDHVIHALTARLVSQGVTVVTFNFQKIPSLNLGPETTDYLCILDFVEQYLGQERPGVLLGGYSFGSLIAANLPLLRRQGSDSDSDSLPRDAIGRVAAELRLGEAAPLPSDHVRPVYSYLLVSPLLPPTSLFLGLFSAHGLLFWKTAARERERDRALREGRVLMVFGGQDQFTTAAKVRSWGQSLGEMVTMHEDPQADHFWRTGACMAGLLGAIDQWLGG